MRVFIAAEIPEDVRSILSDYIRDISSEISGVKWEKPEKIHLTLRFLGEQERSSVEQISESLGRYISVKNVVLNLSSFGCFPDLKRPRVFFVGIGANSKLTRLKQDVDRCLENIGFSRENREYIPHLTIGRVKKRIKVPEDLPEIKPVRFSIDVVTIFRSELRQSGSVHIPVKNFKI